MNYKLAMQRINPEKVLTALGIEYEVEGGSLKFDCECGGKVVLARHSENKNLFICPSCKRKGNIIQLAIEAKGINDERKEDRWAKVVPFFKNKMLPGEELTKPLPVNLDLHYHDAIKKRGIEEEICKELVIGVPKGRNIMAGHIAFEVQNSHGDKVAYYGINLKTGKPKIPSNFDPECHLLYWSRCNPKEMVIFTDVIWVAVEAWQQGKQAIYNFGLEYLSAKHIELLNQLTVVDFMANSMEMKKQTTELITFHRFSA